MLNCTRTCNKNTYLELIFFISSAEVLFYSVFNNYTIFVQNEKYFLKLFEAPEIKGALQNKNIKSSLIIFSSFNLSH